MACDMTYYRHLRASSEPVFQGEGLDNEVVSTSGVAVEQTHDSVVNNEYARNAEESLEACC